MRKTAAAFCLITGTLLLPALPLCLAAAQQPAPPTPASGKPSAPPRLAPASAATPVPAIPKKPVVGPVPPQSNYHPILLLVQGSDQTWSLRIGLKGPERLDRNGYPPIPLDPGEVVREGTTEVWTYHAKDSQTGAAVSVHIARTPCADAALTAAFPTSKFVFTASVLHEQVGFLEGCARVAAELFPKINNQPSEDDDDDAKEKPAPPTITKFKPPVYVAYVNGSGKMLVKRGTLAKSVPGKAGYDLSLSHDGKKLLFTRDEQPSPLRSINEFDFATAQSKELLRANARQAVWSPDDSQIAFLVDSGSKWQLWSMPADAPEKAALLYPGEVTTLDGWVDAHTLLVGDLQTLSWIGDDGSVKQTLSSSDLYGKNPFGLSSGNTVRVHPLNPDLLLVSAEVTAPLPPQPQPAKDPAIKPVAAKEPPKKDAPQPGQAFFLYEISSKRRVILSPPNLTSSYAEWSRDGLQIFFTGREPSSDAATIFKMFWDGTSQTKYQDGWGLVIGQ